MKRIRFKINYEVKQIGKFEKFLERYQTDIGFEIKELKIDRYWKNEEQFQGDFYIEIKFKEKEMKVYETLILANKLWSNRSSNWSINGPHENESLIFECILNNENDDHPIKWAHLALENE